MIGETLMWVVNKLMGLGTPQLQWPRKLCYQWRRLRGKLPAREGLECVNGYLYVVYHYEDGSTIYLRDRTP